MKKLLLVLMIGMMGVKGYGQMGEWTWMNGDSTANNLGHYGIQGIFDSLNTPPGLYEACEWTDNLGNFWLFGGVNDSGIFSDLWKFNPSINQWAWIKGPGIPNQIGIYGIIGIPSPANNPGGRSYAVSSWTDSLGNLWLFGGIGIALNNIGNLGDLWKYDISTNEWTWMKGDSVTNRNPIHGTLGIANNSNIPGSRYETCADWTFNNCLWLFGGVSNFSGPKMYSDLWKYDISINEWTWMKGDSSANANGIYGTKGVSNVLNYPSGRGCYSHWKDNNGNLWIWGGLGISSETKNDLWKYNIALNEWVWISGDSSGNNLAIQITPICSPSNNNIPSGRYESRACWINQCNNLEFFGGCGTTGIQNDLWNYNIITNEWTLISGDTAVNLPSIYGTKTVSNSNNRPSNRFGSNSWKDNNGDIWIFGGGKYGLFGSNDLWRFVPDTTCPVLCSSGEGITETTQNNPEISLYPNPTSGNFTLSIRNFSPALAGSNWDLRIIDVLGQEVYSQPIINQESTIINLPQISNGVYFYQLTNSKESFRGKFVKEN